MKILFIDTGNTCRSPMAEALYLRSASSAGRHDVVISRGTANISENAAPIGKNWMSSQVIMQYYGIDISQHLPKSMNLEDIVWADLILTMTKHQVGDLRQKFAGNPELMLEAKVHTLGNYLGLPGSNVEDPAGQDYNVYLKCAKQIEAFAKLLVNKLILLDTKAHA